MKSQEEIVDLLSRKKPQLAESYGVKELALFGSYARGDQDEHSDIDLLVEVDSAIGLRFVDLAEEVESTLGQPVDLVSSAAISDRARQIISSDLIYV